MIQEVRGKNIWVLGMATSGVAVAQLLHSRGANVLVSERKPIDQVKKEIEILEESGITWEAGGHEFFTRPLPDFVIISPGIPLTVPVVKYLKEHSIPVAGELEAACWFFRGKMIFITGSNGKTTITEWITHVLRSNGFDAVATGNMGYPLSRLVMEKPDTAIAVVEVSSYQLETLNSHKPWIGAWTNQSPDHLARHGEMETYLRMKARIWENQDAEDVAIYPAEDSIIADFADKAQTRHFPVRDMDDGQPGVFVRDGWICARRSEKIVRILPVEQVPLPGHHNLINGLFCAAVAIEVGVNPEGIAEGLRTFAGVPHRLEKFADDGRTWINDSKSTNVDSLKVALEAVKSPIWLILGGEDKGTPFEPVAELISEKVTHALVIGQARNRIIDELKGTTLFTDCGSLEKAVEIALSEAPQRTSVLLSPACASFDQFENFEHRGKVFQNLVNKGVALARS